MTGSCYWYDEVSVATEKVLRDVAEHRVVQFTRYGDNAALEDGTGPDIIPGWVAPYTTCTNKEVEAMFRHGYEMYERVEGAPTWMHLVREEVAEAFQEADPVRLREELVQVAALCVSWMERIDARPAERKRCPDDPTHYADSHDVGGAWYGSSHTPTRQEPLPAIREAVGKMYSAGPTYEQLFDAVRAVKDILDKEQS